MSARQRSSLRWGAAAVSALALSSVAIPTAAGAAAVKKAAPAQDFSGIPAPAAGHGTLLSATSLPALSGITATAWHLRYTSTTSEGASTIVTGTLLIPTKHASPSPIRPVAVYAPGTQGWADSCAPSAELAAGNFDETFALDNLLGHGWAVVVTDYPGMGTDASPSDTPYAIGIPEGFAVLDAAKAAVHVRGAGLSSAAKVGIEGYSQGGGAAGWAAQLAPTYTPDVNLVGVAMGGTPANLQATAANLEGSLFFGFLAGTAIGLQAAYPELNIPQYLTPTGAAAIAKVDTQCQIDVLVQQAGKKISDYTINGIDPTTVPAVNTRLTQNNLGRIFPKVPVLQYHGLLDEVIPYSEEQNLHNQWCAAGVVSKLNGYVGEHPTTQVIAQGDVNNWLADRMAGKPAPNSC